MEKNNIPLFINKQIVSMLLQSNQVSAQKVSLDLGWGADALGKYLRYENKIPKERREELAKYFNIKYPSKLANYQPTKAIRATYERYSNQRTKRYELRKQNENENENVVTVDRHEWETAKMLLSNSANSNNATVQKIEELDEKIDNLDEKFSYLINIVKKLDEKPDTRQGYNVKLLKDINHEINRLKLAARYNR